MPGYGHRGAGEHQEVRDRTRVEAQGGRASVSCTLPPCPSVLARPGNAGAHRSCLRSGEGCACLPEYPVSLSLTFLSGRPCISLCPYLHAFASHHVLTSLHLLPTP